MAGAMGSYSSAIHWNPKTTLGLYESILKKDYAEAMRITAGWIALRPEAWPFFEGLGSAAYDKMLAHLATDVPVRPPHKQLEGQNP